MVIHAKHTRSQTTNSISFAAQMNVTTVQIRDHSKRTVQLVTRSHPGSFVGISLLRAINYGFKADNEVSPSRILQALYQLEPHTK